MYVSDKKFHLRCSFLCCLSHKREIFNTICKNSTTRIKNTWIVHKSNENHVSMTFSFYIEGSVSAVHHPHIQTDCREKWRKNEEKIDIFRRPNNKHITMAAAKNVIRCGKMCAMCIEAFCCFTGLYLLCNRFSSRNNQRSTIKSMSSRIRCIDAGSLIRPKSSIDKCV